MVRFLYKRCLLLLALLGPPGGAVHAQPTPAREAELQRLIEDLFPGKVEGFDFQAVYDNLYQLYAEPLDLNRATPDELAATQLLSPAQLTAFFRHRDDLGPLLSLYELQAIPGFDLATIRRLLPFVTLDETGRKGWFRNPTDHSLVLRAERVLEQQRGFSPAIPDRNGRLPRRYEGDPTQWYLRYRYSRARQYSFGLTLEQDPGEPFRWEPGQHYYGVNYLSFHASVQNRGRWRNVTVGDFQAQAGQGLVLAGGFFLGKGAETVASVRRPTLGTRPYTALTEYGFLRGLTATYALSPQLDLTLLAARNRRDANVVAGRNGEPDRVSSLQTSGLHRTPAELEDRASLGEGNLGLMLHYRPDRRLELGLTALQTSFDKVYQRRNQAYNQYEFYGDRNRVIGLHGNYRYRNLNLFGELAHSSGSLTHSGGWGAVGGALASLTKQLDVTLVGRHYAPNFHSFYANAFGEGSRTINEQGVYLGVRYVLYRRLTVGAYADRFRFPWLRYLVDKPSAGRDYLLQTTWTPTRQLSLQAVWHAEQKERNLPRVRPVQVVQTTRRSLMLNLSYAPNRIWSIRTRVQRTSFGSAGQGRAGGWTVAQDASVDLGRLSLSGRLAWFATDDWDSRVYVYERDVPYAFSIPAYHNQGLRNYLLLRYTFGRRMDLWLRWSRTQYRDRTTVGSDLDTIDGPRKSEVKAQLRFRL